MYPHLYSTHLLRPYPAPCSKKRKEIHPPLLPIITPAYLKYTNDKHTPTPSPREPSTLVTRTPATPTHQITTTSLHSHTQLIRTSCLLSNILYKHISELPIPTPLTPSIFRPTTNISFPTIPLRSQKNDQMLRTTHSVQAKWQIQTSEGSK
ncbi:hypothetical protein BDR22DRAFT_181783 [Usnea florida]